MNTKHRQRERGSLTLRVCLFEVVRVQVTIAACPNELTDV